MKFANNTCYTENYSNLSKLKYNNYFLSEENYENEKNKDKRFYNHKNDNKHLNPKKYYINLLPKVEN